MIGIIDYGLGNLRSVRGAVERLGSESIVSGDLEVLALSDGLILPGVGAFGDGMRKLKESGLASGLTQLVIKDRKPILGICLGAQLMTKRSEEFGNHDGLGWVDARVERLPVKDLPLPHVGWNDIEIVRPSLLYRDASAHPLLYFVHTYHIKCQDSQLETARCQYGLNFTASFEAGNIFGTQFHPEKSQAEGLLILSNFLDRCCVTA